MTYKKMKTKILLAAICATVFTSSASAKEKILVNSGVTTHIVMPENIKLVDISTDRIMGNQCTDNIVRIKPSAPNDSVQADYKENELLGTVTLIGERHIAQYDIVYTREPGSAASIFHVPYSDTESYVNPGVSMPVSEMSRYAWAVYGSKRKFHQVVSNAHGIRATVNNIYSVGDYFFIDFSIENKTNIRFDIDEIRVKLSDKKLSKATNAQTIELTPALVLEHGKTFKHGYRNVIVVKKMTFPNDKLLTIEMTEQQISGRNISLNIDYEDVLSADSFNTALLEEE